jgi:hypothetical protein
MSFFPSSPRFAGSLALGPPTRWERLGLIALLVLVVGFGAVVEIRGALLKLPHTDLQVFLRAAWAVRTGGDLYTIADNNDWHYHYPPLLAILLMPLADAPPGVERTGLLPFALSVGLWYVFSLVCLGAGIHVLARALEETAPDPAVRNQPIGCRRWWCLRLVPLLACLPTIGATLARGQVNLLLLALLCFMAAALLRNRSWQAGLWLAGAMCLKVIPAFLLLYPLWRRNGRCLAGCALGLVLGIGVIPAAWFGPQRTVAYYGQWFEVLVRPALGQGQDQSRARELLAMTATDSQSLMPVLHRYLYPDPHARPPQADPSTRGIHFLAGALLTLATLLAAGWRSPRDRLADLLFLGTLVQIMLLLSPVCHPHYFCLGVPLVMALTAAEAEATGGSRLRPGLKILLALYVIGNSLSHTPVQVLRDAGLSAGACLLLWLGGVVVLVKRGHSSFSLASFPLETQGANRKDACPLLARLPQRSPGPGPCPARSAAP